MRKSDWITEAATIISIPHIFSISVVCRNSLLTITWYIDHVQCMVIGPIAGRVNENSIIRSMLVSGNRDYNQDHMTRTMLSAGPSSNGQQLHSKASTICIYKLKCPLNCSWFRKTSILFIVRRRSETYFQIDKYRTYGHWKMHSQQVWPTRGRVWARDAMFCWWHWSRPPPPPPPRIPPPHPPYEAPTAI